MTRCEPRADQLRCSTLQLSCSDTTQLEANRLAVPVKRSAGNWYRWACQQIRDQDDTLANTSLNVDAESHVRRKKEDYLECTGVCHGRWTRLHSAQYILYTLKAVCKAHYTLSVKPSEFTVLRHTGRKNWVICADLTGNSAGLTTVLSRRLSNTQNSAVHSGNPTVSSVYLPKPRCHHLKSRPFLEIHSADEHRMIYSFSNTTSYCTFYAFFSSFRLTLWPMWLANSKRQPCFYPPQSQAQED